MWLPAGCTKIPWGFVSNGKNLVATSSASERSVRAELGEFAITLLGKLGIAEETLRVLAVEADPLEALKRLQNRKD